MEGGCTFFHSSRVQLLEPAVRETSLWKSFGYALEGLRHAVRTQRNLRIHIGIAALVVAVGIFLDLPLRDWAVLALTIGAVLTGELINTVVEAVVDLGFAGVSRACENRQGCRRRDGLGHGSHRDQRGPVDSRSAALDRVVSFLKGQRGRGSKGQEGKKQEEPFILFLSPPLPLCHFFQRLSLVAVACSL